MSSVRALSLIGALLLAGAAVAQVHVAANGTRVAIPPIDGLSCAQKGAALRDIDASGYRSKGPDSAAASDRPLLEYENALSSAYYSDCVRPESTRARENAFGGGFLDAVRNGQAPR